MNCLFEAVAGLWVAGLHALRPHALEGDLSATAREQLQQALAKTAEQQALYARQLALITAEVRGRRALLSKSDLRRLLLRSRRIRSAQASLDNKAHVMDGQLTALDNNEFNKVVLSTLQASSKAMLKMGLHKDLRNTDQVISELEEGMQVSGEFTDALSAANGNRDGIDEAELEAELAALLAEPAAPSALAATEPAGAPDALCAAVPVAVSMQDAVRAEAELQPAAA
jgi:hypothetical protein